MTTSEEIRDHVVEFFGDGMLTTTRVTLQDGVYVITVDPIEDDGCNIILKIDHDNIEFVGHFTFQFEGMADLDRMLASIYVNFIYPLQ